MSVITRVDERLTPDRVQPSASRRPGWPAGLDEDHVRAFCAPVERERSSLAAVRADLPTARVP